MNFFILKMANYMLLFCIPNHEKETMRLALYMDEYLSQI